MREQARSGEDMEAPCGGAVIYFRHDEDKAHQRCSGRRPRDRRADRRRRLCRAGAGHRAAPGARRLLPVIGRRSGARPRATPATRAPRRSRPRRGGCSRPSASGSEVARRGAADPRHGGHRFQAAGRDAADLPDLRRRGRAGRAVRAHDREHRRWSMRCVERAKADGVELRADAVTGFEAGGDRVDVTLSDGGVRARAACWSPPTARARRSARRAGIQQLRLGLRSVRHRHHRRRTSAIITAAPRSISCRRDRSRSCR